MASRPAPGPWVIPPPVRFEAGDHTLLLTRVAEGRWTVTVDEQLIDQQFSSEAEAWEKGVGYASRLPPPAK